MTKSSSSRQCKQACSTPTIAAWKDLFFSLSPFYMAVLFLDVGGCVRGWVMFVYSPYYVCNHLLSALCKDSSSSAEVKSGLMWPFLLTMIELSRVDRQAKWWPLDLHGAVRSCCALHSATCTWKLDSESPQQKGPMALKQSASKR